MYKNQRSVRPNVSHQRRGSQNKPPLRRPSALSSKSPLNDQLLDQRPWITFYHAKEPPKENRSFDIAKTTCQPNEKSVSSGVLTEKVSLNHTQDTALAPHSQKRKSQVWTHPSEQKFRGLWQQYEDIWFGIHSGLVKPLLADFPLPTTKKPIDIINDPVRERREVLTEENEPVATEKKPKEFKIRQLSCKTKKQADDLMACGHCKQKKRRGVYIDCGHYFCRDCLRDHIQSHIDNMKVPIRCLYQGCSYELTRLEIVKNASNSENVVKYFDLNITDFVKRRPHQMVQCFTEGCKYVVDMTKTKSKNAINCPNCKVNYCIACHKPMKKGHSCEDQNNLEATNNALKQNMPLVAFN